MPLQTRLLDSPLRQAERALRHPSTAVWLQGVTVRTHRFEDALGFYVNALGLGLGGVDVHPVSGRPRARLLDGEGHPILTLAEADEAVATGTHELTFGMPRRTVTLLRSRLSLQNVPFSDISGTLCVSDVDGTRLQIVALA